MSKTKVLQLGGFKSGVDELDRLKKDFDVLTPQSKSREEFLQECRRGQLDGIVVIIRTASSAAITGLFDEELVNALPKSLKFICHKAAGYDQIDVAACTARDIRVSNVPTAVDNATADTAMFLILGALRGFNAGLVSLREGKFLGGNPFGYDPQEKVLGILGMGGIGGVLAQRAQAFGMSVQYHNRRRATEEPKGCKYVSFDELLATSDVISLNLPLNKNTRHIISTGEFWKMKDGVTIVNTARGAVMDESALVKALEDGKVWSAGLDVFEKEPEVHPELMSNPRVMLLPHMGTHTRETEKKMEDWTIANARAALETGKLKSPVPEQADL